MKEYNRRGLDSLNCIGYSRKDVGLTGIGQINGTTLVFDITSPTSNFLEITPKQLRPCNAVSFNGNGLVAVGLDKLRQDYSLQIWNVENYSKATDHLLHHHHHQNQHQHQHHQQQLLLSYVQNEAILSAIFHPNDPNCLLSGSYKFLREFDLRSDQHVFQLGTRCTSGIAVDPFSDNFFASHAEDGTLCIWDRRKLTSSVRLLRPSVSGTLLNTAGVVHELPLLTFNKLLNDSRKGNYSNACFKYSPTRRGEFSTLFNGELIRRWNTGIIPPSEAELRTYQTYLQNNKEAASQNPGTIAAPNTPKLAPPFESLFVVSVNDIKTKYERVVSFDYAPDMDSRLGINFICMRQSGSLYKMSVVETQSALEFNSFNDITLSGPDGTFTQLIKDVVEAKVPDNLNIIQDKGRRPSGLSIASNKTDKSYTTMETHSAADSDSSSERDHAGQRDNSDHDHEDESGLLFGMANNLIDAVEILENDISCTIRRRAMLGYGTDTSRNVFLIEQSPTLSTDIHLRNAWKWLDISRESSTSNTMLANNIDFSYEGVLGIWNGWETVLGQNRSSANITEKKFDKAVKDIVTLRSERRQPLGIEVSRDSSKLAQRRFCLYIAGWDFTKEELNSKLEILTGRGQYEKAAGWAVFHGDVPRAVEILANSDRERLRIMSTAIAGYMAYKNVETNSPWKDQCRRMASELSDPYLRSIFAFIADNDWWDVFDEGSLPLREKIGVALRFLSDKDLTVFLNRLADKVVAGGELEGLILTGITPKGIDLLQNYVDKTGDVQTAALWGSFACPRFFSDERVDTWIHCYRSLLNSWSLFNVRAKFDVARTKLSKTYSEEITLKPAPRQVYLQCFRCNKNIFKLKKNSQRDNMLAGKRFSQPQTSTLKSFVKDTWESNSCPHCGAPFPRCAICLLSLGTALPDEVSTDYPLEEENGKSALMSLESRKIDKQFKQWFSFCLTCNHGMHAGHAEEWFSKHYVCAVPDCSCRCNNI